MIQLILHLWGDYILQSDWMANNKTSKSFACFCHAFIYTLPFLLITRKVSVLLVIGISHFVIDRFRLAKYLVYTKNFLCPSKEVIFDQTNHKCSCGDCNFCKGGGFPVINPKYLWENCKATGYPSETPPFLAVWLLIIADNTLHLTINYLALKYL